MIELFKSKVLLNVKGKNINRFIKRLTSRKINILSLTYINENEAEILVYKEDYEKIIKIKSIYELLEKDTFGLIKIKKVLKLNRHLIIIFIICLGLFYVLINTIFEIEVVHSNKDIRNLVKEELELNGIKKYTFKKSFKEKEKIKEKILNKHPDKIEWLEIEEKGTKYVIRVEERELAKKNKDTKPRNIVAKKDVVLKKVNASKGDIIRNTDDYVKKGDVIVSGEVMLNEKSMGKVRATGKAYGEVWYVIKTEYPFVYYEEKETGNKKDVYAIKFLNHTIPFSLNNFKHKKTKDKVILYNQILPIKFVKESQREVKVKKWVLTFDEALLKAKELSIKKVEDNLKENEYIIRNKYLKSSMKDSTIEVEMFFAVYEDVTEYKEIE